MKQTRCPALAGQWRNAAISTARLNGLLHLHLQPINLVIFKEAICLILG
jgi:hypothetical protein